MIVRTLRWLPAVLALALAACASRTAEVAAPEARGPRQVATKDAEPPAALGELVVAIEQLRARADEPSHAGVVAVLTRLADVVAELAPRTAQPAERIRALAARLGAPSKEEGGHSETVDEALRVALAVVEARLPRKPPVALRQAHVTAMEARGRVRPHDGLLEQTEVVETAFAALADMIAILHGAPPVFASRSIELELKVDLERYRERARRASTLVSELARVGSSELAAQHAAKVLEALAETIQVAPIETDRARWRTMVLTVRQAALQLRRERDLGMDRSDWIKTGLIAAVEALAGLGARGGLEPFVSNARTATMEIEEMALLAFQRSVVQEAIRCVVDGFLVHALSPPAAGRVSRR